MGGGEIRQAFFFNAGLSLHAVNAELSLNKRKEPEPEPEPEPAEHSRDTEFTAQSNPEAAAEAAQAIDETAAKDGNELAIEHSMEEFTAQSNPEECVDKMLSHVEAAREQVLGQFDELAQNIRSSIPRLNEIKDAVNNDDRKRPTSSLDAMSELVVLGEQGGSTSCGATWSWPRPSRSSSRSSRRT
eukprot:COSAG04_NODE_464_length_13939_cov_11.061922_13_plen_186_part_00